MRKIDVAAVPLVALAIIGVAVLLTSTRYGIGVSPDSTVFIGAARYLLDGRGLSVLSSSGELVPMPHSPPLYPALLAAIGLFGVDPLDGARWLNALLFGANILLVGLVLRRCTRGSAWVSMLGAFLMLTSTDMLSVHSMAWTEPTFILFSLLGWLLLSAYIESASIPRLIAASGVVALAFLTRYPGVALVVANSMGLFFLSKRGSTRRNVDTIVLAVLSLSPMALWGIRNLYSTGAAVDREVAFHPLTREHLVTTLYTVVQWVMPKSVLFAMADKLSAGWHAEEIVMGVLLVIGVAGCFALSLLVLRRKQWLPRLRGSWSNRPTYLAGIPFLLITFIVVYSVFVVTSLLFFDAAIPLNQRILSPIYIVVLVLVLCLAHRWFGSVEGRCTLRVASLVICVVFAGSYLVRGVNWVVETRNDGQWLNSKEWWDSKIVERVRSLSDAVPIFTNGNDAVYFLTGKPALPIPVKIDSGTRRSNDRYHLEMADMLERLEQEDGVLVYFNTVDWRWYLPSEEELRQELPLRLVAEEGDGAIYQAAQREEPSSH